MPRRIAALAALAALCVLAPAAPAAPVGTPVQITDAIPTPWEVVPLPDGRTLVSGFASPLGDPNSPAVHLLSESGGTTTVTTALDGPDEARKFLGMALSPQFATDAAVVLYETRTVAGVSSSRIVRYTLAGEALTDGEVVFDGIASDLNHDGGRILFGPDDQLYVTTGDVHDPSRPQDLDSLNGKILRMDAEGAPSAGNPFADADGVAEPRDYVYSYGHRHPQGLAFVGAQLWATEHGPSNEPHAPDGASAGRDELNRIVPAGNYGWPLVAGTQRCTDLDTIAPVWQSGPAPATAPADLEWSPVDGLLYAPGLNGRHLHVFQPDGGDGIAAHGRLYENGGRLRSAVLDGDDLWITTDEPTERVLRVPIEAGNDGLLEPLPAHTPTDVDCVPPVAGGGGGGGGDDSGSGSSSGGSSDPAPPAPAPPAPAPPAPAPVAPPFAPLATAPPAAAAAPAASTAAAVAWATKGLRTGGLRRVLRLGTISTRARGLRGTVRMTVKLGSTTVARGVARPRSAAAFTLRARLTKAGRAALRRRRSVRLHVRLSYTPVGGAALGRSGAVTVPR